MSPFSLNLRRNVYILKYISDNFVGEGKGSELVMHTHLVTMYEPQAERMGSHEYRLVFKFTNHDNHIQTLQAGFQSFLFL